MTQPDASASLNVPARPDAVWSAVTDLGSIGRRSPETYRAVPRRGDFPAVGSRFRAYNRNGLWRWATTSTVTASQPGRTLAWRVSFLRLPVAEWRYDLEPDGDHTRVTHSTWDHRGRLLRWTAPLATGVRDRAGHNQQGITVTLERLRDQLATSER